MSSPLPAPSPNQPYVTVSPLAGGYITLSDHFFVHPSTPNAKRTVPSLTFLITHPTGPPNANNAHPASRPIHHMFDRRHRKHKSLYPPVLQTHIDGRSPHHLEPGVAAQLSAGGLDPADIDMVILSHVHYDHHGDPSDFPNAQFRVGSGALDVLEHGLDGGGHQHFVPGTLPADRTQEFPSPDDGPEWKRMGPFPATLDLFSDGSVYVIDTPGHLPGHVNLLCRMEGERWVLLCGDAFHDRRLLTGEKEIGTWDGGQGRTFCIHHEPEKARESIRRLREWDELTGERCELIAAHEEGWWEGNRGEKEFPRRL